MASIAAFLIPVIISAILGAFIGWWYATRYASFPVLIKRLRQQQEEIAYYQGLIRQQHEMLQTRNDQVLALIRANMATPVYRSTVYSVN